MFDNYLVAGTGVAILCLLAGLFIPRWRFDPIGLTPLKTYYDLSGGFESKSYGIVHVQGSYSQSWTFVAEAACDILNFAQAVALVRHVFESCDGTETCSGAFASAMHHRCTEYERIQKLSYMMLICTFSALMMAMAGMLTAAFSRRKRTGGISFGLWVCAGFVSGGADLAWVLTTHDAFNNLKRYSWYPYPPLHAGFYVYTAGVVLLLACGGIYGAIWLPKAWVHDDATQKLEIRNWKLQRKFNRKQQIQQEQQNLVAMQAALSPMNQYQAQGPQLYGAPSPVHHHQAFFGPEVQQQQMVQQPWPPTQAMGTHSLGAASPQASRQQRPGFWPARAADDGAFGVGRASPPGPTRSVATY